MICKLTNKLEIFTNFIVVGKWKHRYVYEYTLPEVIRVVVVFIGVILLLSWWTIPIICLHKLYKYYTAPKINWPVFRCEKKYKNGILQE